MKTHLKTTIVAALTLASLATSASAMISGDRFTELATAVTNTASGPDAWAFDVRGNHDVSNIEVYGLSELGRDGAALDTYLATHNADLDSFQSAVRAHAKMNSKLNANGYSSSDVVAYRETGRNSVWLIVDDTK